MRFYNRDHRPLETGAGDFFGAGPLWLLDGGDLQKLEVCVATLLLPHQYTEENKHMQQNATTFRQDEDGALLLCFSRWNVKSV